MHVDDRKWCTRELIVYQIFIYVYIQKYGVRIHIGLITIEYSCLCDLWEMCSNGKRGGIGEQ